ncbi:DNA polymerase [Candidatus Bathyarchaeota archaeon]|nr:MAG: DNA polymerase [Candidatus Bathyarchaeota archaeon]
MHTKIGMPEPEKDPIIVIGVKSGNFEKVITGDSEREIIKEFIKIIKELDPDVIVGYNQDSFDWPYIKKRAAKYGIKLDIGRDRSEMVIKGGRPKIAGRLDVDLYDIALRTLDVKIKTLENVAEYLGSKIDIADIEAKDIYKKWTVGDKESVLNYCKQDVLNTYFIAQELLPMQYELSRLIRIPLDDVTRSGRGKQVEWLLLSEASRIGELAPNPKEVAESYEGAFVLEPARGLHENVICLDFACHPEDTFVVVKNKGKIKISEVKEGDLVLGKNGWHKVKKVWIYNYNGVLIDINGLKCTPNHKIPIVEDVVNKNSIKDVLAFTMAQSKTNGKIIKCKLFDKIANLENKKSNKFSEHMPLVTDFTKTNATKSAIFTEKLDFYEFEEIKVSTTYYKGKVYDLTVEGEPYYFANGILTHNSMYPSIMIAYNISPDTLNGGEDCNVAPEVKHRFKKHPDGFFKRILRMLIEERRKIKRLMKNFDYNSQEYKLLNIKQLTLKVLTNSFYGYTGWNLARWYCRECAEATTAWGRYLIKKLVNFAQDEGFDVLYGDTDSIFIKMKNKNLKELKTEVKKLIHAISKEFPVTIEIDEYYRTVFFVEKKRYAGLTEDGRLIVKGLEVKRGDWCELAKKVQKSVIEIILKEKDPEKASAYVRDIINEIKNGKISLDDYVIYKSITKKPSKYESLQAHVKAAMKAAKKGIVYTIGSKIGFVVTKGAGSIGDRAFPVDLISEFDGEVIIDAEGNKYKIDKNYYINHQVIPTVLRILERFGYTEAQIKEKAKQKTLESFW